MRLAKEGPALALALLLASREAAAQYSEAPPAPAASPSAASSAPPPAPAPATSATPEKTERPARGPAVRERGGRRSRGASAASGALFLVILIGAMGYYVVKRLRR